jgi:hypothetical protein
MGRFVVKRILISVGVVAFAIGAIIGFVQYTLPSMLTVHYRQQIDLAFRESFTPGLEGQVHGLGLTLPTAKPARCDNGPYSISSPCTKFTASEYLSLNGVSDEVWHTKSQALDTYLTSHGWQLQTGGRYSRFVSLRANTSGYDVFAAYARHQQGVTCTLTGSYAHTTEGSLSISEECYKYTTSPTAWLP